MSGQIRHVSGGVAAAKGFVAAGVSCGIKRSGQKDLALVFSEVPAVAHAVFTTNKVKAAPVSVSAAHIEAGRAQAVLINSGNANCCTGPEGLEAARESVRAAGATLKVAVKDILVASTGIIGHPLPVEKVKDGIGRASKKLARAGAADAAQAIMTTDTYAKQTAVVITLSGQAVTIGGMAKGSGMIAPHMATMLAVIATDAAIERPALKRGLEETVAKSFNMISVDGDTSTNDTVFALANGRAGNAEIKRGSQEAVLFAKALSHVTGELAELIVKDGEGATKFIEIEVRGAQSEADARRVALTVAESNLVKCAFFGQDANWGRIMAAIGRAGAAVDPENIDIYYGSELVVSAGQGQAYCAETVAEILAGAEIKLMINLHLGKGQATARTTDLTYDFVKLNAEYTT